MIPALWTIIIVFGVASLLLLFFYKVMDKEYCKYMALVASSIALFAVVTKFAYDLIPGFFQKEKGFKNHENLYMEMGGRYLGRYLSIRKDKPKNGMVVIINYPRGFPASKYSSWIIEGFKRGFQENGNLLEISAVEEAIPQDNSINWFSAEEFDRIILSHPDAGTFISLVGLPHDLHNVRSQDKLEKMPRLVFFGGDLEYLGKAIEYDLVTAAVVRTPGSSLGASSPPKPENVETEFFERFILVDSRNIRSTEYVFPVFFK